MSIYDADRRDAEHDAEEARELAEQEEKERKEEWGSTQWWQRDRGRKNKWILR